MERPSIKIQPEAADKFMDLVSLINLLLTVFLTFWIYIVSPKIIPAHYNIHGKINGYADKSVLFIMPAIAIFLFAILKVVFKHPNLHNYMQVVTEENAKDLYKGSSRMLRLLNMLLMTVFLFLQIQTSLEIKYSLHFSGWGWGLGIFLVINVPLLIFIIRQYRKKVI